MLESSKQINENDSFSDYAIWESLDFDFPEEEEGQQQPEEPSIPLDEDGFTFLQPNEEDEEEDKEQSFFNENANGSSKKSIFAADFYESGTDWSSLRVNSSSSDPKKLKQTNLFQMWGLKRHKVDENDDVNKDMKKKNNESKIVGSPFVKFNSSSKGQPSSSDPFGGQNRKTQSFELMVSEKNQSVARKAVRACPFYKKIPGTPFTVDAFRYGAIKGCSAYFLSHFHADHYGGLSKAWSYGPIYCTPITARLVRMCLSVNPSFICPLELDVEHVISGIKVTLLEANHCPGAALIHFHLPDGQCYLHTGDFRACKSMQDYPLLSNKHVNVLYLDTTYCNPKYRFPSKEEVMSFVVRTAKTCLKRQPRTLIIVGAYSIGKECVYIAISEALRVKIHANASRRRILQSFDWPQLSKNLCSNGKDTPLHVLPISSLRHETLKNYLKTYQDQFKAVVAFRPTGWTFSESIGNQLDLIKPNSKGNIQIYGVPYSEHSSFTEMQEFVQFLKPNKIIPTVNISNAANRDRMQSYFRQWLNS